MRRDRHPFFTWEMTRTGYVTYAILLAAMIAGLAGPVVFPGSAAARWINDKLLAYWIVCAFVMSMTQMVLHVLGYPSARKKQADAD
jgi:hypothetical protein